MHENDEDTLPEDAAATVEAEDIEAAFARLEAELADWKDKALRAAAEVDNTRRRAEREANDARAYAIQRFARDLLGVADNLDRALQAAPAGSTDASTQGLVTGLELTRKSLLAAFEANGLTAIAPEPGERFDPNVHEAVMEQVSDSVAAGGVLMLMQPGYALFGRVVRPAKVAVAARGSTGPAGGGGGYAADGAAAGGSVDTTA